MRRAAEPLRPRVAAGARTAPALRLLCLLSLLAGAQALVTLRIGGVCPLTNHVSGAERCSAVLLAAHHINTNASILPLGAALYGEVEVDVLIADTAANAAVGVEHSLELMLGDQLDSVSFAPVHALVGAASSAVTEPIAVLASVFDVPMMSYASTSEDLSNKARFPTFTRVIPPDSMQGRAIAQLVAAVGWRRVGCVSDDTAYGSGLIEQFVAATEDAGIEVLTWASFQGDAGAGASQAVLRAALQRLQDSDARVFVLAASQTDSVLTLDLAYEMGLVGPDYAWIVGDSTSSEAVISELAHPEAAYGLLGSLPDSSGPLYPQFVDDVWSAQDRGDPLFRGLNSTSEDGVSYSTLKEKCCDDATGECVYENSRGLVSDSGNTEIGLNGGCPDSHATYVTSFDLEPDSKVSYAYDCVFAYASAAMSLAARGLDHTDGELLLGELISNTSFEGLTGPIAFDEQGNNNRAQYTIVNMRPGESTLRVVGSVSDTTWEASVDQPIYYFDGSTTPPADSETPLVVRLSDTLVTLQLAANLLLAVLCVPLLLALFLNRHGRVVRYSSTEFCYIIVLGCLLTFLLNITVVLERSAFLCQFQQVAAAVCFSMVFGCLLLKTWRISVLMNNKTLRRRSITNSVLLRRLAVLTVFNLAMPIAWIAVDAPVPERRLREGSSFEFIETCNSASSDLFNALSLSVKGLQLLWGVFVAQSVRHVAEEFNESSQLVLTISVVFLTTTIALPISLGFDLDPEPAATLISVSVMLLTVSVLGIMFGPKMLELYEFGPDGAVRAGHHRQSQIRQPQTNGSLEGGSGSGSANRGGRGGLVRRWLWRRRREARRRVVVQPQFSHATSLPPQDLAMPARFVTGSASGSRLMMTEES